MRASTRLRASFGALVLTLVATGLLVVPAPALADPIGSCTRTTGTIVAVDFGHWGGPVVRGCGVNSDSGYDLLGDAGFTTAGTVHDGPAFICRLGNSAFHGPTQYPTPAEEACSATPPASAYWSYWLAPAGQHTWSYSQLGAMSDTPKPGEVELWTFGATNIQGSSGSGVPDFSPDTLRPGGSTTPSSSAPRSSTPTSVTHAPPTRSASLQHTTHPTSASSAGGTTSGSRSSAPASSSTPSGSVTSAVDDEVVPAGTGETPTSAANAPSIVNAQKTSTTKPQSSAMPLILVLVLVVLLGGGAGYAVRQRRREG